MIAARSRTSDWANWLQLACQKWCLWKCEVPPVRTMVSLRTWKVTRQTLLQVIAATQSTRGWLGMIGSGQPIAFVIVFGCVLVFCLREEGGEESKVGRKHGQGREGNTANSSAAPLIRAPICLRRSDGRWELLHLQHPPEMHVWPCWVLHRHAGQRKERADVLFPSLGSKTTQQMHLLVKMEVVESSRAHLPTHSRLPRMEGKQHPPKSVDTRPASATHNTTCQSLSHVLRKSLHQCLQNMVL